MISLPLVILTKSFVGMVMQIRALFKCLTANQRCACVWEAIITMMPVERNEQLISGWSTDPDTSAKPNTYTHTPTHIYTMPHPIKASQYAVQWEWFARALSVWMLIEELWDLLAKADNNWETSVCVCVHVRVCVCVPVCKKVRESVRGKGKLV